MNREPEKGETVVLNGQTLRVVNVSRRAGRITARLLGATTELSGTWGELRSFGVEFPEEESVEPKSVGHLDEYQRVAGWTALPADEDALAVVLDALETADVDGDEYELLAENAKAVKYALGIVGEAGEVAEKVKKAIRESDEQYLADAVDELGDVLWYIAEFADEQDVSLSTIAQANLEKLADRQERGVITGEGDDR